mmetsp:Transcript_24593/g.67893  ORF Transcript_24593/g.67893 Transcript_24593/m.67893 type:complete len:213 (-) Transcript_24593:538-1176(-)
MKLLLLRVSVKVCGHEWISSFPLLSVVFASQPPPASRRDNAVASILLRDRVLASTCVHTTVVINSRRSVDAEDADAIHDGQLSCYLHNPQDNVRHTNVVGIVGKMARGVAKHGGNDKERPLDVEDLGTSLQLFPQRHCCQLSVNIKGASLEPMDVNGGDQAVHRIGDRPAPVQLERFRVVVIGERVKNSQHQNLKEADATHVGCQEQETSLF